MLEATDGFLQLWQAYCDKKAEVEDLKEQRAELLEALKKARKELELYAEDAGDDPCNDPSMNDLIAKVEASE